MWSFWTSFWTYEQELDGQTDRQTDGQTEALRNTPPIKGNTMLTFVQYLRFSASVVSTFAVSRS